MKDKEKIVIIGYGWVGQANALALTMMGYRVFYYDVVPPKLHYQEAYAHIYGKINGLTNPLEEDGSDTWYLISVGDRVSENGIQDISLIIKANELVKSAQGGVILRSTVLPQNLEKLSFDFYVPEFLHEKHAVEECGAPFYFVIGKRNNRPEPDFFKDWTDRSHRIFRGTPKQASYIKYLSNIWNALRIAFVNEFGSTICDSKDPNNLKEINEVIDFVFEKKNYLKYGRAFSGHCLPKDTLAFFTAYALDKNVDIIRATHESNLKHKNLEKERRHLPEWFSNWSYDIKFASVRKNFIVSSLRAWNASSLIQSSRRRLRFLNKAIQSAIPNKSLSELRSFWNKLAKENARYFVNPSTPSGKEATEFELRETGTADYEKYLKNDFFIKDRLGNFSDKLVLDLGCGVGRITEYMINDFKEVKGLDISEEMIESAKKRLAGKKGATFHLSKGNLIPLDGHSIDLVFSYQTFQHFPSESLIKDYLDEVYRVLKSEGIAKIHLRTGLGTYKWHWFYGLAVTPELVRRIAKQAGLNVLRSEVEGIKNLWVTLGKNK